MRFTILFAAGTLLAATAGSSYMNDLAKWRADYEASLRKPDGWLSLVGLFWLHEGDNVVGSDPQSDIVLPAGSPKRAGVLRFARGKVTYQSRELKPDVSGHPDVVKFGGVSMTIIVRGPKTGVRLRDPNAATLRDFTGSKWFAADPAWRIQAKWVAYPQPKKVPITDVIGVTEDAPVPGYAEFTVKGKTMRLEPIADDDGGLFFIFKDATSGKATYGAGRFLDTPAPKSGVVDLDFNKAYNPPCAFTSFATCPLPPKQNALTTAIEAGEKSTGRH